MRILGTHHLHVVSADTDDQMAGTVAGVGAGAEDRAVLIDFAAVWRNWEQVWQVVDRHTSTRVLEHHLRTGVFPDRAAVATDSGPVVVPIDRWGAVPLPLVAMTPAAVATVLAAHLTGTALRRRPLPARPLPGAPPASGASASHFESAETDLGSSLADTYAAGVAARRAAQCTLADLPGVFDDVDDRVEELLRRTLALLDDG